MKNIALILTLTLSLNCSLATNMVDENFSFALKQTQFMFQSFDAALKHATPAEAKTLVAPRNLEENGSLHLVPAKDWCSGFFAGNLWFLYEYSGNAGFKNQAALFSSKLEKEKLNYTTHDMGFKLLCSYGNGYRITRDSTYRAILIQAARTLTSRFNPTVGCIRSWDHNKDKWSYPVIIDNMMNLELLFFAFNQTHDSAFYKVAVTHALTTMKNHFRENYSCFHVVDYDVATGKVVQRNTHQGLSDASSWARGQAWALYGYTVCYRETHDVRFLNQARNVAAYIFSNNNLPSDLIPYWDFNAAASKKTPRDVSAATVMASALYELSLYDSKQSDRFKSLADTILSNLTLHYRSKLSQNKGFLLLHSTGSFPQNSEIDVPIIYADYYFLEALLRKKSLESGGAIPFNSK